MSSLSFDLAHLTVLDTTHLDGSDEAALTPESLHAHTTASFLDLFHRLTNMDRADATHVALPPPTVPLPRAQPIPTAAPRTRWEQFVQNKGLKVRKKEAKVFDEATGEWRLRYGYRRPAKAADDWLVEVPNGVDEDPFATRAVAKRDAGAEQQKRERRNQRRAERAKTALAAVSPKKSFRTEALKAAVARASAPGSSASMNQFNALPNKPPIFEDGAKVPKLPDRTKGRKKRGGRK